MNDLQSAGTVAMGLKPIVDLAKSLLDVVGAGKGRQQAVELYGKILAAQAAETALLEEKRQLEAELADRESEIRKHDDWEREKERYQLSRLCPVHKAFAYVLKPDAGVCSVPHELCPHCFEDHRKRYLASGGNEWGVETLTCSDCGYQAKISRSFNEPDPGVILEI